MSQETSLPLCLSLTNSRYPRMSDQSSRPPRRERTASLADRHPATSSDTPQTIIEISDDDEVRHRPTLRGVSVDYRRHRNTLSNESIGHLPDNNGFRGGRGEHILQARSPVHKRMKPEPETQVLSRRIPPQPKSDKTRDTTPLSPTRALIVGSPSRNYHGSKTHNPENHSVTPGSAFAHATPAVHLQAKPTSSKKKKKKKAADEAPYYVDSRLEVKMYQGPGYERFPVVLGTVKGDQELCNKWDAEQMAKLTARAAKLRQAIHTPYVIHDTDSESSDELDSGSPFEKQCLASVLDVFPDIERAFVMKQIQPHGPQPYHYDNNGDIVVPAAPRVAGQIIAGVLRMGRYPKERVAAAVTGGRTVAEDGTGVTVTWDRNMPKGDMYTKDAIILLAKTFGHVPTYYIARIVAEKNSIFDAYVHIHDLEARFYSYPQPPYHRLNLARTVVEQDYQLVGTDRRIPSEYANRINELQAAKQHVARQAIQAAAKKAISDKEAANLARHKATGAIMECQCCFDDEVPLNRLVSCMADPAHFFCFSCVEGLADTQIGLMKYQLLCMDGSGCTAELSNDGVGKAIPIKTFDRLQLNKQQAEIIAAGLQGLEECQFCDYKAVCEDVTVEPVFYCQNPDCARATCRKCNKDSHLPRTCEENNEQNELSARHLVEEARSEAVMRTCPKCKVKIVKEYGCNKMTCSNCRTLLCYECKADLSALPNPYTHFNEKGSECSLYDEEGVDRHDAEADMAETEAIDKVQEQDVGIDASKLRIETGKPKPPPAWHEHPAAGVFLRGMNNAAGRMDNQQIRLRRLRERNEMMQALLPDAELAALLRQVHQGDEVQLPPMRGMEHRPTRERMERFGPPLAPGPVQPRRFEPPADDNVGLDANMAIHFARRPHYPPRR